MLPLPHAVLNSAHLHHMAREDGGQQPEFETTRRYCSRCVPHTPPKLTAPQRSFVPPFVRGHRGICQTRASSRCGVSVVRRAVSQTTSAFVPCTTKQNAVTSSSSSSAMGQCRVAWECICMYNEGSGVLRCMRFSQSGSISDVLAFEFYPIWLGRR